MYALTYKLIVTIKQFISTLHYIDPKMLNKKEGPNVHGVISHRRSNKTFIGSRWKRENWIRESMSS